ncbi:MAG: STAS domain-containing protein [Phycisphaerae bacterium]|nr:STAS domain-containing protein [Phycisphaerae bacterium]
MSIERWSDNILVVDLQDDPAFTDDLNALIDQGEADGQTAVILDFKGVNYVNSSNIAKLLKLRKKLLTEKRRLVLCEINTNVWGLFLVTGLDKVFEFTDNVAIALAGVQMASQ